jgi:hypothetical protein
MYTHAVKTNPDVHNFTASVLGTISDVPDVVNVPTA